MQKAIEDFGRIDVLVNNAGIFPRVDFLAMTEADWDQVLAVNLKGSAFCAQAAARAMVAAGIKGSIMNLSSSAVRARPWASITARPRTAWSASPAPWPWPWRRTASG
ncbi:SDR family NAD(P)-dependent oxidoreductase [Paeniroseomonas aquatica]|uniref:SDR family NAD(P)-dependent oxidoreductase n=1 Tax=Paeniroseomonas aquatica TaxID=373043 RepID=UPI00361BC93A